MRQQTFQPTWILELRLRKIADTVLEIFAVRIHRSDHDLIAEHKFEIDFVGRHLDFAIAAGHARKNENAILPERAHALKDYRREARRFKNEIERSMLGRSIHNRRLLRRYIAPSNCLNE